MRRALAWIGVGALVVLGARSITYALSPSPLAMALSHQAGGPALPLITIVSLALGLAIATAAVWLATLGVRERRLLETRPILALPRLRIELVLGRALVLWLVAMPAFAFFESYIHWRQGLGWHGLHCLTGPVHRNAIPVLGALSLVAAALAAAVEHVLGWIRRTIARLSPRLVPANLDITFWPALAAADRPVFAPALPARGPPPHS
jgi:hypothetical protein